MLAQMAECTFPYLFLLVWQLNKLWDPTRLQGSLMVWKFSFTSNNLFIRYSSCFPSPKQCSCHTRRYYSRKVHTMMVWDNIDFLEETPTGAGTTHMANGIIIQQAHDNEEQTIFRRRPKSSKEAV